MAGAALSVLRTRSQQRADKENDDHIGTAEWTSYINEGYSALWDEVIRAFGDHFVSVSSSSAVAGGTGANTMSLPTDFYLLRKVQRQDGGRWHRVSRFNLAEGDSLDAVRYRLMGNSIYFEPFDACRGTYRVWYVPGYTALSADVDTIDTRVDTWNEFIVVKAAIAALNKEESDTSVLERQLATLTQRIHTMARARDAGEPDRIADIWADDAMALPSALPRP